MTENVTNNVNHYFNVELKKELLERHMMTNHDILDYNNLQSIMMEDAAHLTSEFIEVSSLVFNGELLYNFRNIPTKHTDFIRRILNSSRFPSIYYKVLKAQESYWCVCREIELGFK